MSSRHEVPACGSASGSIDPRSPWRRRSSIGGSSWIYAAPLGAFAVCIILAIAGVAEDWTILLAKLSVAAFFVAQAYDQRVRQPRRDGRRSHEHGEDEREFVRWLFTLVLIGVSVALILFAIRGMV